jgi:hypothetical protein
MIMNTLDHNYTVSHVTRNPATRMRQLFGIVTNSFLAATAACCRGGLHVKWDILCLYPMQCVFLCSVCTT